jgi:hypothetical protein
MNGNPTAAQIEWHGWMIDRGCMITSGLAQLHHIGGSRMKLKGVVKPGEWFCIPICPYWHKWDANKAAIHTNKKAFERENGTTEKELFIILVEEYELEFGRKPMSEIDYQTIISRG